MPPVALQYAGASLGKLDAYSDNLGPARES